MARCGKHQGLLTTFLQQQAVTGLAKHFIWLKLRLTKIIEVEKWAIFSSMWCQTQTNMHPRLNSKNAVGITEKCRRQTNYAVVRVKATFCQKCRFFEVLGMCVCVDIYMVVAQNSHFPGNGHSSRINMILSETFANSMFIFRGAHVGQRCLLWRFIHPLLNYAKLSRITSW